jgi:hypothetical protein
METSSRRLLIRKNTTDNWNLAIFNNVFQCVKCRRYNPIKYSENIRPKIQNCQYCFNPNYTEKK